MATNPTNSNLNKTPEQLSEDAAKRLGDLYVRINQYMEKRLDMTDEELAATEKKIKQLQKEAALHDKVSDATAKQIENAEEYLRIQKLYNQQIGLSSSIISGINSKLGSKLGTKGLLSDMGSITEKMNQSLRGGGKGYQALWTGIKASGSQMAKNFNSPMVALEVLSKGVVELNSIFKKMDTSAANLARSMNLTYENAWKVRKALMDSSIASGELSATGESLSKSMIEMNSQLGTAARFDNERLITYTKLRDVAKFEAEVLEDINRTSLASKQTQLDVTKNRLAQINLSKIQLGRQIDERKVMQDIAKASYNIKINYLGRDKDLAKAATQARAFGMELSQTEKIAESLMDFEGSIQKQMEAELLTGRTLNLERARYYALTNDITGLQTELNKQGITAEKFGKMNRIQQSAIAESMGMSKEEMSKMLVEQKALQNLGVGSLEAAQKEYELAVKNGTVEEYKKKLGDDSLARQFQQQSLQERMTMAVEKMLSAFEKLAVVFKPLYQLALFFVEALGKSETLLKSMAALVTLIAAKKMFNLGSSLFGKGSPMPGMGAGGMTPPGGGIPFGAVPASAAGTAAYVPPSVAPTTTITPGGAAVTMPAAATAATSAASSGGGFLGKMMSGAKGLIGKTGIGSLLSKAVGPVTKFLSSGGLGAVIGSIIGIMDFKSLMQNPIGTDGNLLSKKQLTEKAGNIVSSSIGGILGTLIGSSLGGPLGGLAGQFGGSWLLSALTSAIPGLDSLIGKAVIHATGQGDVYEKAPSLYEGGVVEKTGLIKAHAGEVYTGGGTLKMFEGMWQEMKNQNQQLKEQNRYLAAIANKSTVLQLDRQVLATEMGKEVAMSYGNILNPGSQTFS
jgi:hypothetical protein